MRCGFTPLAETDLKAIGDYIARGNPRPNLRWGAAQTMHTDRSDAASRTDSLRRELDASARVVKPGLHVHGETPAGAPTSQVITI
jgi:hypothetical protein